MADQGEAETGRPAGARDLAVPPPGALPAPADPAPAIPAAPAAAPVGGEPALVKEWFDAAAAAEQPVLDGTLAGERDAADAYARMAKAENTRRAYRAAVRAWCAWCDRHGLSPLPARGADVAAFLAGERAGKRLAPNTIDLRRAAIRYLHRAAGCPVPTDDACVSETVAGIRRDAAKRGEAPRKKVAATATVIRRLLAAIPDDLAGPAGLAGPEVPAGRADLVGLRDRAIILVGFAGALRRAELAAIHVEHLEKTDRGIKLTLPRSKGAQTAAVTVPLPYGDTELCPVRALDRWLAAAGITEGPVFRRLWLPPRGGVPARGRDGAPPPLPRMGQTAITPQSVAQVVQARAVAAGFRRRDLGGHSLKRGALTTGMEAGVHPAKLKRLGRHKSFDVLGEYLEFGDLFDGHPLSGVL